jgi:hypothetical protein
MDPARVAAPVFLLLAFLILSYDVCALSLCIEFHLSFPMGGCRNFSSTERLEELAHSSSHILAMEDTELKLIYTATSE